MHSRVFLATLLVATTTGCWTDACVRGRLEPGGGVCHEVLTGPLDPGTWQDSSPTWCAGDLYELSTCRSLGYEVECQGNWYRPTSPAVQSCPSG